MPFYCNHSSCLAKINKPKPFKRERDLKVHLWVEHKVPNLFECGKNLFSTLKSYLRLSNRTACCLKIMLIKLLTV